MKYPEENLLLDLTLRREKSIEFYQSRKWCQGDFEADDAASCQVPFFVVCYKYESYKPSSLFLLPSGKRGSGEPAQPGPAIRGRVDSYPHWKSTPGSFLPEISRLLGDVQGPLEDRADAL